MIRGVTRVNVMYEHLIQQAAMSLVQSQCVVAFTGAGVSAESGVPTFRGSGGLWEGFDPQEVATPQGFAENPKKVWKFYNERRKQAKSVHPNPAHESLAKFEDGSENFIIITQNIDGLHQRAGSKNVVELHGSLYKVKCTDCSYHGDSGDDYKDEPRCPECGNMLRPAIVWFYESLPAEEFSIAEEASRNCDLMLSIGTSSIVQPAASLIWQGKANGATIIEINPEPTAASDIADIRIRSAAGEVLPEITESALRLRKNKIDTHS